MPQTTFFIIIPSFNQVQFITETVASVLSQKGTFRVRLVIMDGGSTDGTKQYLQTVPKSVYWVSEKDAGQTNAINKGLQYVKTQHPKANDIVAYINSDDFYLPGAFERVVKELAKQPQSEWLVGDAVIVDATGKEIQKPVRLYKQIWRKLLSPTLLALLNPIPQPAVFITWRAIEQTGLFTEQLRYVMDYDYWHRLFKVVGKPLVLNQALAGFRIHGSSKGGSQFEQQFAEELQVAGRHSQNKAVLTLHAVHNWLIVRCYKVIK